MNYFTAHTFKCVCHCIRTMFRVLGVYNFDLRAKKFADNRIAEGTIFAALLLSKQSAAPSIKLFSGPLKTCRMDFNVIAYVFRKKQCLKYYWLTWLKRKFLIRGDIIWGGFLWFQRSGVSVSLECMILHCYNLKNFM